MQTKRTVDAQKVSKMISIIHSSFKPWHRKSRTVEYYDRLTCIYLIFVFSGTLTFSVRARSILYLTTGAIRQKLR